MTRNQASRRNVSRAMAKADYTWNRLGFPCRTTSIALYVQWMRMVRWYERNPSCFWGTLTKP